TATAIQKRMEMEGIGSGPSVACLVGPTIAYEIARKVPTLVQLASSEPDSARNIAQAFSTSYFHCRQSPDLAGVETCAAYKNIYTIALSWPAGLSEDDGCGDQTNLKAILFLQTMHELRQLVAASGGDPETVSGIAGIGDLVTTAESGRNGKLGKLLGSGQSVNEALDTMAESGIQTIEGYEAAKLGIRRAEAFFDSVSSRLPLLHGIHQVIHSKKSVREVIDSFELNRLMA
ncbi:MAG TPA: hypothetical protein VJ952_05510, partial [Opitutales bacterium]|nr:hypothetical protein [Opitutales bacterium]